MVRLTNRQGQRETWSGDGFQRRRAQVEARRFCCHARNEEPRLVKGPCVSDDPIHQMHAAQTRRQMSRVESTVVIAIVAEQTNVPS